MYWKENRTIIKFSQAIVLLSSILFLFVLFFNPLNINSYLSDSNEYIFSSRNLLQYGNWYAGDFARTVMPEHYSLRPPFFPIYLIPSFGVGLGLAFFLAQQIVLTIFTFWLIYNLLTSYFVDKTTAWLSLAFVCLLPAQLYYAGMVMSEILFQFELVLLFFFSVQLLLCKSQKQNVLFGISLVSAALLATKPVALMGIIALLLFLLVKLQHKSVASILGLVLLPVLIYIGICSQHYKYTSWFHYSSIPTHNLVDYNLKYFLNSTVGENRSEQIIDSIHTEALKIQDFKEQQEILNSSATHFILQKPFAYAFFHLKGLFGFFLDSGRFDAACFWKVNNTEVGLLNKQNIRITSVLIFLFQQPLIVLISMVLTLILKLILLAGLILGTVQIYKRQLLAGWLALAFILYIALLTGPLGASRFWLPVMPFQVMIAALGFRSLFKTAER